MRSPRAGSAGLVAFVVATLFVSVTSAFAQEKGKIGLTMGFPSSVGFIFHVTDKIAIRPEVNFSSSSTEIESDLIDASSDTFTIGTGVSALFYLRQWEDVHVYVTPRWTYAHSSSSQSISAPSPVPIEDGEGSSSAWGLSGSFGAQYALGKRFAVFGEVGIAYTHSSLGDGSLIASESTGSTIGTRAGVGVILYFK